jgi:hypothetical protein
MKYKSKSYFGKIGCEKCAYFNGPIVAFLKISTDLRGQYLLKNKLQSSVPPIEALSLEPFSILMVR